MELELLPIPVTRFEETEDRIRDALKEFLDFSDKSKLDYEKVYSVIALGEEVIKINEHEINTKDKIERIIKEDPFREKLFELGKINLNFIGEKRFSDFLISFLYNLLEKNPDTDVHDTLLEIERALKREQKRKLEHYLPRIKEELREIGKGAERGYEKNIRRVVNLDLYHLEFEKLNAVYREVKERMTLNYIIIAMDVAILKHRSVVKNVFGIIRENKIEEGLKDYDRFCKRICRKKGDLQDDFNGLVTLIEKITCDENYKHLNELSTILSSKYENELDDLVKYKNGETELEALFKRKYPEEEKRVFLRSFILYEILRKRRGELKELFESEISSLKERIEEMENVQRQIEGIKKETVNKVRAELKIGVFKDIVKELERVKEDENAYLIHYIFGYTNEDEGIISILRRIIEKITDEIDRINDNIGRIKNKVINQTERKQAEANDFVERMKEAYKTMEKQKVSFELLDFSKQAKTEMEEIINAIREEIPSIDLNWGMEEVIRKIEDWERRIEEKEGEINEIRKKYDKILEISKKVEESSKMVDKLIMGSENMRESIRGVLYG